MTNRKYTCVCCGHDYNNYEVLDFHNKTTNFSLALCYNCITNKEAVIDKQGLEICAECYNTINPAKEEVYTNIDDYLVCEDCIDDSIKNEYKQAYLDDVHCHAKQNKS